MNELALFAGAGGGILAGQLLGWRTVCAVERDAYAAQVLAQRQNDRTLEAFPIWSDVCSFDGTPWRGIVDVVSGGFPCQDISTAGKRKGIEGERSGLWKEMARIIREVRPRFVFVENSPALTARGLGVVLGDLAEDGFDAAWGVLSAGDLGAWHERERIWIVAHAHRNGIREQQESWSERESAAKFGAAVKKISDFDSKWKLQPEGGEQKERRWFGNSHTEIPNAFGKGLSGPGQARAEKHEINYHSDWWKTEPNVVRVVHGLPHRVDRIRALGNAQVPIVAASAFQQLLNSLDLDR